MSTAAPIAVYTAYPNLYMDAKELALALQLPWILDDQPLYPYQLVVTPNYLGLQKMGDRSSPVFVDFLSKKLQYRCKQLSLKKEFLSRALGLKKNTTPRIVDATAGLGRDSFIIASLGFEVVLCERSPIIHALLLDGMARARKQENMKPVIDRMHLKQVDTISYLQQLIAQERPDVIYLDPMFPERKKTALPKKEMLIFHDVVGGDPDAHALLNAALLAAAGRVVVKRPLFAEPLKTTPSPSYSLTGSSSRFDVYILN